MELEADNSYLKYLYPKITRQISEFVEEECDKMEYEGSLMFDVFPDKIALQDVYKRQVRQRAVLLMSPTALWIRRAEKYIKPEA